jgi:hypothetical protein
VTDASGDDVPEGQSLWLVTWGVLARPGFVVEHVVAHDADEALAIAAERRPELERPRVALLASPR